MTQRPASARPMTGLASARPRTSRGSRPPTGISRKPSTDAVPPPPYGSGSSADRPGSAGTARRLSTANARPPSTFGNLEQPNLAWSMGPRRLGTAASRSGMSRSGAVPSFVQRPVTQQGLQGLRPSTGRGLQNRQIQDKSYYVALLRAKIADLTSEMSKLRIETEHCERERQNFALYEKKAENLAAEIRELQGDMSDLNMVIDKLNINADPLELQQDYERLSAQNDAESSSVDELFSQKKKKEIELRNMENAMAQEKLNGDNMLNDMNSETKRKFEILKDQSRLLIDDLQSKQRELAELHRMKEDLEDDLHNDQIKREAILVQEKIAELESKKATLSNEIETAGSVEDRKKQLLDKVKKDNEEIASMERQINDVREKNQQLRDEMTELDEELENRQSENNQKYRELRQKESQMDEFLNTYDKEKDTEQQRLFALQKTIVNLLMVISKVMEKSRHMVSNEETHAEDASDTTNNYKRLRKEWIKLSDMESTYLSELENAKASMEAMRQELMLYKNLQALDDESQSAVRTCETEIEMLTSQIDDSKKKREDIVQILTDMRGETETNELYLQILTLDKKLKQIIRNNSGLRETIEESKSSKNSLVAKENLMNLVASYNKFLIQETVRNSK